MHSETQVLRKFSGIGGFLARGVNAASVAFGVVLLATTAIAASRADTLQAIHWVENPTNSPVPGRYGELGAHQFRASTWEMHTRRPFAEAVNRENSDAIALLHYEWLKTTLTRAGVSPTTYNIALAWNAGVNAVIRGRAPLRSRDYAARVNNLAAELSAGVVSSNR